MANIANILTAASLLNPTKDPTKLHLAGADHDVIWLPSDPIMDYPDDNEAMGPVLKSAIDQTGAFWSDQYSCWTMFA